MKKIITIILCLTMLFGSSATTFASEPPIEQETLINSCNADVPLPVFDPSVVEGIGYTEYLPLMRGATTIRAIGNTLTKVNSTGVSATSTTLCTGTTDKIQVVFTLYQYRNNTWNYYDSQTATDYRLLSHYGNAGFTVKKGYSYFIKTVHSVYSGNTKTDTRSISSTSIYV